MYSLKFSKRITLEVFRYLVKWNLTKNVLNSILNCCWKKNSELIWRTTKCNINNILTVAVSFYTCTEYVDGWYKLVWRQVDVTEENPISKCYLAFHQNDPIVMVNIGMVSDHKFQGNFQSFVFKKHHACVQSRQNVWLLHMYTSKLTSKVMVCGQCKVKSKNSRSKND